jgi:hypothetical protein
MAKYRADRIRTVARYDIPAPLAREIGRFLVVWAHFEHYVQALVWSALEINAATGRIAIREPRVTDRIDMLVDLGELQNIEMDYVLLLDIRKRANSLAGLRHILAHSLWTQDKGTGGHWCALITRGAWADTTDEIENYPLGSKAVQPEARPVTVADVRDWRDQTVKLIDDLKLLDKQPRPRPPKPSSKRRS